VHLAHQTVVGVTKEPGDVADMEVAHVRVAGVPGCELGQQVVDVRAAMVALMRE
jgi:hypothetical protein